jgi:hypothetical protein
VPGRRPAGALGAALERVAEARAAEEVVEQPRLRRHVEVAHHDEGHGGVLGGHGIRELAQLVLLLHGETVAP